MIAPVLRSLQNPPYSSVGSSFGRGKKVERWAAHRPLYIKRQKKFITLSQISNQYNRNSDQNRKEAKKYAMTAKRNDSAEA